MLCLIPFNLLLNLGRDHQEYVRYFLVIKIIRLHQGFEIFKLSVIMTHIKNLLSKRLLHIIATNPEKAND